MQFFQAFLLVCAYENDVTNLLNPESPLFWMVPPKPSWPWSSQQGARLSSHGCAVLQSNSPYSCLFTLPIVICKLWTFLESTFKVFSLKFSAFSGMPKFSSATDVLHRKQAQKQLQRPQVGTWYGEYKCGQKIFCIIFQKNKSQDPLMQWSSLRNLNQKPSGNLTSK